MSIPSFDDYRKEYLAERGIGNLLYDLIFNITQDVARPYPAHIYSPNQVWDTDSLVAVCHDFTMDRLLGKGRLNYFFLTQETTEGLVRCIQSDLRHYLINHRQRSEYLNLFGRLKRILSTDSRFKAFYAPGKFALSVWGLSSWANPVTAERSDEVIQALAQVQIPRLVRYRPDSKKFSHVLSTLELGRLLEGALLKLGKSIPIQLLMDGLRYRLDLLELDDVSLDEEIGRATGNDELTYADITEDSKSRESSVAAEEILEDIFNKLSDRQRRILHTYLSSENPTLETVARTVSLSKSLVHNELGNIEQLIHSADTTQEEVEIILSKLADACEQYSKANHNNRE